MVTKPRIFLAILLLLTTLSFAQNKNEREHRIKKTQFPEGALSYIQDNLEDTRKIRFYKEVDGDKTNYKTKFKKGRLKYSMAFDEESKFVAIEFAIKPIDIPNDGYDKITIYLTDNFIKYRVLKIQQLYPLGEANAEDTINNAFQNLMLPYIKYKFVVKGKKDSGFDQYEFLFNAEGIFEVMRKALPANYDHVLY